MQGMNGVVAVLGILLAAGCAADDADDAVSTLTHDELATPAAPSRYDFTCHGVDQPTRAADPVMLDAFINDSYGFSLLPDAVVDLIATDDDTVLDRTISDEGGTLAFRVTTGGAPVDHYTRTTHDLFVTSYVYPSGPLVEDESHRALPLLPPVWRAELALFAGVALDPTKGIVEVIVTDCVGNRVEGATVDFHTPGATVAYWDLTFTDASATTTTQNGHAWAFNVPPGVVDATITVDGLQWRSRPVQSFADSRTLTWRAP